MAAAKEGTKKMHHITRGNAQCKDSEDNEHNNTTTITFAKPHGLKILDPFAMINVASNINGYYIVTVVNDLNSITINLPLVQPPQTLTGNGLGLTFIDQRVEQPADINNLDLNEAEFGDYFALLKPRVMSLVVFTAAVGLFIAPGYTHPFIAFTSIRFSKG